MPGVPARIASQTARVYIVQRTLKVRLALAITIALFLPNLAQQFKL
jgi:hypothetical protein